MLCVLPLFSGQLNLFLFPQYFSFSLFFCLFLFLNTDDIQINDRSIAGGSPKGHDWECWGQKFLMHLMWGGGMKQRTSALGICGLDSLGGSVRTEVGL